MRQLVPTNYHAVTLRPERLLPTAATQPNRRAPGPSESAALQPEGRKPLQNLWILWKKQDVPLWNLWITALRSLSLETPLAIIATPSDLSRKPLAALIFAFRGRIRTAYRHMAGSSRGAFRGRIEVSRTPFLLGSLFPQGSCFHGFFPQPFDGMRQQTPAFSCVTALRKFSACEMPTADVEDLVDKCENPLSDSWKVRLGDKRVQVDTGVSRGLRKCPLEKVLWIALWISHTRWKESHGNETVLLLGSRGTTSSKHRGCRGL